jgi:peptide-methionine (S)-S-oxide reductase
MKSILFATLTSFVLLSCSATSANDIQEKLPPSNLDSLQTAYFASGCFWCVEAVFESVNGVEEAVSGYSGGEAKNATYSKVSSGRTKHAEAVKVYYDSSVVSFETLVDVFFNSHDPTTLNQQGPDRGTQYRSIAFYQNNHEKEVINGKISSLLKDGTFSKITTQVVAFDTFYKAEEYHQDYERNNPNNGYVQNVSLPRLNAFKKKMPEVLK